MTPMDATTDADTVERSDLEGSGRSTQASDRADFVSQLADSISRRANVHTVFGDPVNHGAVTVIPVAKVAWGFGGGSGGSRPGNGGGVAGDQGSDLRRSRRWGTMRRGDGGGGGVRLHPMGYILVRNSDAEFRPIRAVPPVAIALIGLLLGVRLGATRREARR